MLQLQLISCNNILLLQIDVYVKNKHIHVLH